MSVVRVELTEDMIKLISNIRFQAVPDIDAEVHPLTWGIDFYNLYGGTTTFEDIAYILGRYDEHIVGTEENPRGTEFPKEVEDYMWGLHSYIVEHIGDIEELVHQFTWKGGLIPGTYKCKDYEKIWEKE